MATLLFRARTVAVTSLNTEQLRRAHALNARWLPIAGGPAGAARGRAAATTPRSESRLSRIIPLRNMFPLSHFAREAQGPPETDRADDLVDADHDHDQRLQRYPPLGKSAAGSRRQAESDPRLGDEPQ